MQLNTPVVKPWGLLQRHSDGLLQGRSDGGGG